MQFYGSNSCFPQLTFCCCGCSLRTGVLIMGWISAVCGGIYLLLQWPVADALLNFATTSSLSAKIAVFLWVMDYFINGVLATITAVILLIGVHKNNSRKVLPYLIVGIASAIKLAMEIPLFTFTDVGTSVVIKIYDVQQNLFPHPLVLCIALAINFYFLAVINSHYVEMEGTLPR